MIVPAEGRNGVGTRTRRQIGKKFSRLGVYHAQGRRGVIAARGVEMVVARVVPDFVRAVRAVYRRNRFAGGRVDDDERPSASTTDEQVLRRTKRQTRTAA